MSDYEPKSFGETYLRYQIARHKAYKTKMANSKNPIKHSMLSVPMEQAVHIVDKHKENMDAAKSAVALLEELETLLDGGYESYSPTKLRSICKRALLKTKQIR